jgi:hypothetical protein
MVVRRSGWGALLSSAALMACSAGDDALIADPDAGSWGGFDAPALDRIGPNADSASPPRTDGSARADGAPSGDAFVQGDGASGRREVCGNGLDDDGNGRVDDTCVCIPGTAQPCYPGPALQPGRGPCAWGTQGCEGEGEFGTWTECVGAVTGSPEVCGDGIDQDCSGRADDGPSCACRPGERQPCYTGPRGTGGVGICRIGQRDCLPDGSGWGTCLDEVLPRAELCANRLDDDCDGVVDNGPSCACAPNTTRECYPGPREEVGRGVCRAGTQRCNTGGTAWDGCTGAVGPSQEVCGNGLDDDCDGTPDDGCPPVRTCTVTVNLNGDCVTARCPAECPYPVGCNITMEGGDPRGCVASMPGNPVVYFQEGDVCGAGRVTGSLRCSSVPGAALNATNCPINKPTRYYPPARSGCPSTS